MSDGQNFKPAPHVRLDLINDQLHSVRRVLENPTAPMTPQQLDVLSLAVQHVHDKYESLAVELRRDTNKLSVEAVEQYIAALPWDSVAAGQDKTVVAGNLRAFAAHFRNANA